MKSLIIASLMLSTVAAQAATFKCYSLEEGFEPRVQISVGNLKKTTGLDGNVLLVRPVKVIVAGKVQKPIEAVGKANAKALDLVLLQMGDIAVGSLNAEANGVPGRLSGEIILAPVSGNVKISEEIGCEVKK